MDAMLSVHRFLALFIVGYAYVQYCCLAAPHNGHTETGTMKFYYDPTGHFFVGATASNCYLVQLTAGEQDHVHTNQGIEDIELRMLHDWLGKLNETQVFHDDPNLSHNVNHWCANMDIYLLNRVLPVEPAHSSPITG